MWWCLKTYFIVVHCLAAKYLTYKITENKFVVYSFLIHDSLLFSINAFILSGVYQSTIPPPKNKQIPQDAFRVRSYSLGVETINTLTLYPFIDFVPPSKTIPREAYLIPDQNG